MNFACNCILHQITIMLEFWDVEEAGSVSFDVLSRSNVNLWLVLTVFGTFLAFFACASNAMQSNQSLPGKGHHLVADVFVCTKKRSNSKQKTYRDLNSSTLYNFWKSKAKLIISSKDRVRVCWVNVNHLKRFCFSGNFSIKIQLGSD